MVSREDGMNSRRRIASEKRELVRELLSDDPPLTHKEINDQLKEEFGSGISRSIISKIKKDMNIFKPKKTITQEDVIVLQSCCEIDPDIREVLSETVAYMRDIGIAHLELDADGSVTIKLMQEMKTVV